MPEDFEAAALGLQVRAPKKPVIENQHVRLTGAEMAIIAQAPESALYQVLLKIMEGTAEKLETHHMQCWKDRDLFDRTGILAVASQLFFEAVQKEVLYQVSEYNGDLQMAQEDSEAAKMTPEDYIRKGFGV